MASPEERGLQEEVRTIETLETLSGPSRPLLVALYVVAAYWPWWLVAAIVLFLVSRFYLPAEPIAFAVALVVPLAYMAKRGVERYAERVRARA